MINQPHPLKKGDTVAITCPAKKPSSDLSDAVSLLESWGLNVIIGQTVHASHHQFAGSDELRAQEFQQFMDDNAVKAIFAARGGYGTIRMIDRLDFSKFQTQPKWIVGFSDITVLHCHVFANFHIQSIHGQMPQTIADGTTASLETLRKALFNESLSYQYPTGGMAKLGEAEGILVGGNLSLLIALSGSVSEIDYRDKILFIEDVGEYLYAIDRMLWVLKRSGKLALLKGLIVGGFTEIKDNDIPFGQTVEEIILAHVNEYDYPVCFNFPAGHIANNQALVFGNKINLKIDEIQSSVYYIYFE